MIVVAYFQYDTHQSAIQSFSNDEDAKNWLYKEWGFLLTQEQHLSYNNLTLEQFCRELRECDGGEGLW